MTPDLFHDLPPGPFGLIYADPPWSFSNFSAKGEKKNPKAHYDCMDVAAIEAMPVRTIADRDCVLAIWATFPMLPQALQVMDAWGFTYKTGGAWGKQSKTGKKLHFGTGYIFRSAAELLLIGTRGKPGVAARNVRNLWLAPVREHSRKPNQIVADLEALWPDAARLELFARSTRPGWHVWGNQTDKFDGGL